VVDIPVTEIVPAPDNPRQALGNLDDLIASIRTLGVLQPLLLVREEDRPAFVIVCGERRWAAAVEAGLRFLPCTVARLTERERVEAMLVENLQRSSLTKLEEAHAFRRLIDLGHTQTDIARRIGKSQAYVCRRLRLLALSSQIRQQVDRGEVAVERALGYDTRPPENAFAADEQLQRAWLALRDEILRSGDSQLIRRLREFALAHTRWRSMIEACRAAQARTTTRIFAPNNHASSSNRRDATAPALPMNRSTMASAPARTQLPCSAFATGSDRVR
jgi:ParB family chromosome partitioning protein